MTKRYLHRAVYAVGALLASMFPIVALAQNSLGGSLADQGAQNSSSFDMLGEYLMQFVAFIDNFLVPLLFGAAFVVFIYGVFQYFIAGGANEEKRDTGKQFIMYGLIGFFVMVSVWGLVNLLVGSAGLDNGARPDLPVFGGSSGSGASSDTGAMLPTAGSATDKTQVKSSGAAQCQGSGAGGLCTCVLPPDNHTAQLTPADCTAQGGVVY